MESEFVNPFADHKYTLTSLEKALQSDVDGSETPAVDRTTTLKKKDVIVRGVLSVTVISAEDLPVMDVMGKADPYVVISMKKSSTKNRTRVTSRIVMRFVFLFFLSDYMTLFFNRLLMIP